MSTDDDEKVGSAEMGDKTYKTDLEAMTSMCTSTTLEQIHNVPIEEFETEPSTSGDDQPHSKDIIVNVVSTVNVSSVSPSKTDMFKVLQAVEEPENEMHKAPSATPPPTYQRTPPTYSAVMRMGPIIKDPTKLLAMDSSKIFARVPPPSYAEVQGILDDLPRQNSMEEVTFGPDPVYMVCPHCSAIVITETYSQRSAATHVTAICLCLFGCWPCCILPYFMDSCKNTYHHCPVCNYFFGAYHPW